MKWFGTKAARADARPVLARAWGSGGVALGEWPASYEAQLRAGVMSNAIAQRALRLVSEGAGATALKPAARKTRRGCWIWWGGHRRDRLWSRRWRAICCCMATPMSM